MRVSARKRTIRSVYKTYIDTIHIKKSDSSRLGISNDPNDNAFDESDEIRAVAEERNAELCMLATDPRIYERLVNSIGKVRRRLILLGATLSLDPLLQHQVSGDTTTSRRACCASSLAVPRRISPSLKPAASVGISTSCCAEIRALPNRRYCNMFTKSRLGASTLPEKEVRPLVLPRT